MTEILASITNFYSQPIFKGRDNQLLVGKLTNQDAVIGAGLDNLKGVGRAGQLDTNRRVIGYVMLIMFVLLFTPVLMVVY